MADGLDRLLDYLIRREIVQQQEKSLQLTAGTTEESAEALVSDQHLVRERERRRVADLGPVFAEGLRRAYDVYRAGGDRLVLDDRLMDENAIADALVQFLVRPDLATSHTEPTEPNHYRYQIAVDWTQLAQLAAEGGVDLDRELTER